MNLNKELKEVSLLASAAVFKKLRDSKKDIYDILVEFIKSTMVECRKSMTVNELSDLVCAKYNFTIPEGVFKTALKKKSISKYVTREFGKYHGTSFLFDTHIVRAGDEEEISIKNLINEILMFANQNSLWQNEKLNEPLIFEELQKYLIGIKTISSKMSFLFEIYITSIENDTKKMNVISGIKEGLILYSGIKYEVDPIYLGPWRTELNIYLDLELIFNFAGYNGEYHKRIFDDLNKLIKEINAVSQNKINQRPIKLMYLKETKYQLDGYFAKALELIQNRSIPNPGKKAMCFLVNGRKNASDLDELYAKLMEQMDVAKISEAQNIHYLENPEFNLVSDATLKKIQEEAKVKNFSFDEKDCENVLKQFSRINQLRKGVSLGGITSVNHVILTGSSLTKHLSLCKLYKENAFDVPYATDIDWLTNLFWHKQHKGFGSSDPFPTTFNIMISAKIGLSAELSHKAGIEFTSLQKKKKNNEITDKSLAGTIIRIKDFVKGAEDINSLNVNEIIDYISSESLEKTERENFDREIQLKKGKDAESSLITIKRKLINRQKKAIKKKTKYLINVSIAIVSCGPFVLMIGLFLNSWRTAVNLDSTLSKRSFIFTFLSFVWGFSGLFKPRYFRFVYRKLRRYIYSFYLKSIDYENPI